MNRGAAHQDVFADDSDRKLFLNLWSRASARFDIEIVSYCLMGNHFHFLVISTTGQLSRALQFVSQTYTQRFNARHGRDGALFRGRFHSVLVDSDVYFERVGRYIELNPVAAGLVPLIDLDRYAWSSFQYYAGRRRCPSWLAMRRLLDRYRTAEQYLRFVQSNMSDLELHGFYEKPLRPCVVLGRSEFVQHLRHTLPAGIELTAGVEATTVDKIDEAISSLSRCKPEDIQKNNPGYFAVARRVAIELAYALTDLSQIDLATRYRYPTPNAAGAAIRASRTSSSAEVKGLRSACLSALGLDETGHWIQR